eukprot:8135111-Prorocentrum_lima.AAC.1
MKYVLNSRGLNQRAIWIWTISTVLEQLSNNGVIHFLLHVQLGSTLQLGDQQWSFPFVIYGCADVP